MLVFTHDGFKHSVIRDSVGLLPWVSGGLVKKVTEKMLRESWMLVGNIFADLCYYYMDKCVITSDDRVVTLAVDYTLVVGNFRCNNYTQE